MFCLCVCPYIKPNHSFGSCAGLLLSLPGRIQLQAAGVPARCAALLRDVQNPPARRASAAWPGYSLLPQHRSALARRAANLLAPLAELYRACRLLAAPCRQAAASGSTLNSRPVTLLYVILQRVGLWAQKLGPGDASPGAGI